MNKKFFTTALLGVLALCGVALSAQDSSSLPFVVRMDLNLKDQLTNIATNTNSEFGYKKLNSSGFVSLSTSMAEASKDGNSAIVSLGDVSKSDSIQFGFANSAASTFEAAKIKVSSDSGYSYSYNPDNFFSLDFEKEPFNGNLEIYVTGTPLPPSTVTLLVALGAGAIFLLYNDRRRRTMRCSGRA